MEIHGGGLHPAVERKLLVMNYHCVLLVILNYCAVSIDADTDTLLIQVIGYSLSDLDTCPTITLQTDLV